MEMRKSLLPKLPPLALGVSEVRQQSVELPGGIALRDGSGEDAFGRSSQAEDAIIRKYDISASSLTKVDEFKRPWVDVVTFQKIEAERRDMNENSSLVMGTGRLFLSHCWRKDRDGHQSRKRRLISSLSLPFEVLIMQDMREALDGNAR